MKILRNAIQCLKCQEIIVSTYVHDFRYCKCKAVAVDGGNEYLRRAGGPGDYSEACTWDVSSAKEPSDLDGKFLVFGPSGKANPSVAFDSQEGAVDACKIMAQRTGQKLWYAAKLIAIK